MKTAIFVLMLAASRPAPLDPNMVPFGVDPNLYTADLLDYVVAEPNISFVAVHRGHNRGGMTMELDIVMADGTPTDTVIQALTPKPVKDGAGEWDQSFQWSWTPPAEGVYYLELRLSTKGKPAWKGDRRTVAVYSYGEDVPYLWVADVPILRLAQAQRLFQVSVKQGRPMTSPTRVYR